MYLLPTNHVVMSLKNNLALPISKSATSTLQVTTLLHPHPLLHPHLRLHHLHLPHLQRRMAITTRTRTRTPSTNHLQTMSTQQSKTPSSTDGDLPPTSNSLGGNPVPPSPPTKPPTPHESTSTHPSQKSSHKHPISTTHPTPTMNRIENSRQSYKSHPGTVDRRKITAFNKKYKMGITLENVPLIIPVCSNMPYMGWD